MAREGNESSILPEESWGLATWDPYGAVAGRAGPIRAAGLKERAHACVAEPCATSTEVDRGTSDVPQRLSSNPILCRTSGTALTVASVGARRPIRHPILLLGIAPASSTTTTIPIVRPLPRWSSFPPQQQPPRPLLRCRHDAQTRTLPILATPNEEVV